MYIPTPNLNPHPPTPYFLFVSSGDLYFLTLTTLSFWKMWKVFYSSQSLQTPEINKAHQKIYKIEFVSLVLCCCVFFIIKKFWIYLEVESGWKGCQVHSWVIFGGSSSPTSPRFRVKWQCGINGISIYLKTSSWWEAMDTCQIGHDDRLVARYTLGVSQVVHSCKGLKRACKKNQSSISKWNVVNLEVTSKQDHQNAKKKKIVKSMKLVISQMLLLIHCHVMNIL